AMACAAVLTSACTDTTPLAPRPNLTRSITASMMSPVAARSHPNSEKYRDSGFQPATGRSGSASVSTRALLDKAGTTDVEATAVHFRPDLVASRLDAPAQAPVGAAVNLQGFILERNGEVGARADCVLYVDGAAADRATGIWVDAGGMVACAMTHVFTEARTY